MNQSKDSQVDAFETGLQTNSAPVGALSFDTLITNAKVFNNGEAAVIEDVAIAGGRIVARGQNLDQASAEKVIDAKGLWLMPGLFDIHTVLEDSCVFLLHNFVVVRTDPRINLLALNATIEAVRAGDAAVRKSAGWLSGGSRLLSDGLGC